MIDGSPRILIIRLSAIGDVVRVLPALHTLRDAYPTARVDWAVEAKSAGILEGHPGLDTILVFERPPEFVKAARAFLAFCKRIRDERYDILADFHGIFKTGMMAAFSAAPLRYGFARPRAQEGSYLFTRQRAKVPRDTLNRVQENLRLCELMCPASQSKDVLIYVPPEVQDDVNEFFESEFDGGKLVVAMHVPVDRPEKQWPLEYFAELLDALLADGRFEVLLTWGPGQFASIEQVLVRARRHPVIAPETADLKHYAWLAHRADLYFGGDTGPMHIAWAMGTPVAAVFGGTNPAQHAPHRGPCEILYEQAEGEKLSAIERLRRVTPEMAYDACVRLAAKEHAASPGEDGHS